MNGKYVIRMGKYYVSSKREKINSMDITLEKDLRDACFMGFGDAMFYKSEFGGDVLKINLELEEVE